MIFVFVVLAVASLCIILHAFLVSSPKALAISECLMIAATATSAAGAISDVRLWVLAGLSGAFALTNIHAVSYLFEKEKGEKKEKRPDWK